jgi:hypothetical protein
MKIPKAIWFITIAVALLAGGAYWAIRTVHADLGYTVMAQFDGMPPDDSGLRRWLRNQPGIRRAWTCRTNGTVKVFILMSQDLRGKPALPDLDLACSSLGYVRQGDPFRDCEKSDADGDWVSDPDE